MMAHIEIQGVANVRAGEREYIPTYTSRWLVRQEIVIEMEDGAETRLVAIFSQDAAARHVESMINGNKEGGCKKAA